MGNEIQEKHVDFFYTFINTTLHTPGVRVQRDEFLKKQLSKRFSKDIVKKTIQKNPTSVGISKVKVEKIANTNL